MSELFDINTLIQLLQALYSPLTPPSLNSSIQHQLSLFQSSPSPSAWSPIPLLLSSQEPNIKFFGASTLLYKIQFCWDSLPPEHRTSLKDSSLNWLADSARGSYGEQVKDGEKMVLRKLSSAVTALSMRLESEWQDWLLEVVARVGVEGRQAVLEVLGVVMEQVVRADLVGQKKINYMANLTSSLPFILSTLSSSLSPPSTSTEVNSALKLLHSVLTTSLLTHSTLSTLYPLLLPHLSSPESSPTACSTLEEILELSSGMSEFMSSSSGGSGITRFMNESRIGDLVNWASTEWVGEVINSAVREEEADDQSLGVIKLICAIGESMVEYLLTDSDDSPPTSTKPLHISSPSVQTVFNLLLSITLFPISLGSGNEHENLGIREMTTSFWVALQEEACEKGLVWNDTKDRDGVEVEGRNEEEWRVVKGLFEMMAEGLRVRAAIPDGNGRPKDVIDSFKVYRSTTLAEIFLYAYYVLRSSLLSHLVSLLPVQIEHSQHADLEATLFLLHSISSAILPSESTFLPSLFTSSILHFLPPSSHTTALRLIGSYTEWFKEHSTECLVAVGWVVDCLRSERVVGDAKVEAAKALRELCDTNRGVLKSHVGSFVEVLRGLEGRIEDEEFVRVIESVASVVQALPDEEIVVPILALVTPLLTKLLSSITSREITLQQLSYLTACAKGLAEPQADLFDLDGEEKDDRAVLASLGDMKNGLGEAIRGATRTWAGDVEVGQALADFIKHSTSSLLSLDPLSVLSLSHDALQASASPIWLLISADILGKLGGGKGKAKEDDVKKPIEGVLEVVLGGLSSLELMNENLDIVQAFLDFCLSVIRHFPDVFSSLPHHLDAIISFAERGLSMQERFSLKANIDLLLITVQQTRFPSSSTTFLTVVSSHTLSILTALILSIAGGVPRSHLTSLSELLHACILRLPSESNHALKELMGREGWPTEKATGDVKTKFLRAVLNARNGKLVKAAVSDFAMVCRGLDGSAYGAASAAVFD